MSSGTQVLSPPVLFRRLMFFLRYFFTAVAFLPLFSAASAKPGHADSVIDISSMSGITRSSQHHFAHNTSRAAAIQLTALLAQELRRPCINVRVNSIAPSRAR